ncbi:MAG: ATP-binding protein, partial [Fibrobacteraceae bacterium]
MLLSFTVGNFRSFKEKKTLSMKAAPIQEHGEFVREVNDKAILPVAAVYGANSSGKSNLLLAMETMRGVLLSSIKTNPSEQLDLDIFKLDESYSQKPTFFEVVFTADRQTFRYGFEYTLKKINGEWLYDVTKGKEKLLFIRNQDGIGVSDKFAEGNGKEEMTADNRLFLSLVAQLNGAISKSVLDWFQKFNVISGLEDVFFKNFSIDYLSKDGPESAKVKNFLSKMDLGFSSLKRAEQNIEDTLPPDLPEELKKEILKGRANSKMPFLKTGHIIHGTAGASHEEFFSADQMESEGTKKILNMSGPIVDTLSSGQTLVIDELDAKLHPLLTKEIINIFNSPETNPNKAQLIFATHDTNLLSNKILRRDQIWFAEKNRDDESTDIYQLSEIKEQNGDKIRNDRSYEKDYINGKYGAIP